MRHEDYISDFAKSVEASPTISMSTLAKQMVAEGKDVLSFAVGEPDFSTPDNITAAGKQAIDDGHTKYTASSGMPELKEAICDSTQRSLQLSYSPDQVVVSNGGKHALMNVFRALLDPGDEVIVFAPYWVSYTAQIDMAGGTANIIETRGENDFQPDPQQVAKACNDRTKAILINSPSNPSGAVYAPQTIEAIANVAAENDLMVVSDEVYRSILFDGRQYLSPAQLGDDLKHRTIIIDSVSKKYSMTGWRLGWMIAPEAFATKAGHIQSQQTSGPCAISQVAAIEALTGPQDSVAEMRNAFERRRDFIVPAVNDIPGINCPQPGGAFYIFPDISERLTEPIGGRNISTSKEFCTYLIEEGLVSTVHGSAFGLEGYFRISFACGMEQLKQGVDRIKDALA